MFLSLFDHVVKLRCRCGGFRSLRSVTVIDHCLPSAWNGSWDGALDNPSAFAIRKARGCPMRQRCWRRQSEAAAFWRRVVPEVPEVPGGGSRYARVRKVMRD